MFFTACKKQAPQLPSNKGVEMDNVNASLIKINQRLATKEDLKLVQFTKIKVHSKKTKSVFGTRFTIRVMDRYSEIHPVASCPENSCY